MRVSTPTRNMLDRLMGMRGPDESYSDVIELQRRDIAACRDRGEARRPPLRQISLVEIRQFHLAILLTTIANCRRNTHN